MSISEMPNLGAEFAGMEKATPHSLPEPHHIIPVKVLLDTADLPEWQALLAENKRLAEHNKQLEERLEEFGGMALIAGIRDASTLAGAVIGAYGWPLIGKSIGYRLRELYKSITKPSETATT